MKEEIAAAAVLVLTFVLYVIVFGALQQ